MHAMSIEMKLAIIILMVSRLDSLRLQKKTYGHGSYTQERSVHRCGLLSSNTDTEKCN